MDSTPATASRPITATQDALVMRSNMTAGGAPFRSSYIGAVVERIDA